MSIPALIPARFREAFHGAAPGTEAETHSVAVMRLLLDPWMIVTLVLTAVFVGVPYADFLPSGVKDFTTDYLSTIVLLAVAIGAVLYGVPRLKSQRERYFWRLLGLSLSAWLAGELLASLFLYSSSATEGTGVDALYLFFYLSFVLALDIQPQTADGSLRIRPLRVLASAGRTLLLCSLFVYFVVLPRTLGIDEYLTWLPSYFFYVILDLYLVSRLLRVSWHAPSSRWRWLFTLLTMATGFLLFTDSVDLIWMANRLPAYPPSSTDIFWFLPMVLIVAASRMRHLLSTPEAPPTTDDRDYNIKGVPLLVYSSGLVLIHLALSFFRLSDGPVQKAQLILVMICVVVFGFMNIVQNSIIQRKNRQQNIRRREAEEHIRSLSRQDPLTGLLNRRAFDAEFSRAVARAHRSGLMLGLMFIDLDNFKTVNDTYGHRAGDSVLREAAARIKAFTREVDTAARYGGDEFVLIFEALENPANAETVGRRILDGFKMGFQFESGRIEMSASIGIAVFPGHGRTPSELFETADRAMYTVKESGGSGIRLA